ncbi:MAG TPA: hypothetical protein VFG35_19830 [Actinoplanes sp.]|nr:hypothetical protein [Actinoplanes sp.]
MDEVARWLFAAMISIGPWGAVALGLIGAGLVAWGCRGQWRAER